MAYDRTKDIPAIARLIDRVHAAYAAQRNPIPDSDLYDEQPVTLLVSTTLGDLRAMDRAISPSPASSTREELIQSAATRVVQS